MVSEVEKLFEELSAESEEVSEMVFVLIYEGAVYGVYSKYESAYEAAVKRFGEWAVLCLSASIIRQKVQ